MITWQADRPAEESTIRPRGAACAPNAVAAPWLTVLWHPSLARVGDVAPLPERLSRLEPDFATPDGSRRAPLADPHVSRSPVRIAALPGGGLRVAADDVVELLIDGAAPPRDVDAAALARGVVLELAGRVALLLHARRPPIGDDSGELVGASDAIEALRAEIARVGALDVPVLIGGETGSGKEHVARALHAASRRARGPLVAVNVATLAPATAIAQLFGHARGAFTGAERAHAGLFEQATGGTLFLDEIGDAPATVQAMLLRALETGEIQPLGADAPRAVDVRVIAASDADLARDAEFRPQLYHRLAGYRIAVPPLRERVDDLGRLLARFVARELDAAGASERLVPAPGAPPWLPTAAIRAFARYAWPGNVRELANVARHLAVVGAAGPIALAEATTPIDRSDGASAAPPPAAAGARDIGDDELIAALAAQRWRTGAAAAALGISRTTLYALIDRCPRIRKARDIGRAELEACRDAVGGDLDAMSERLQVSKRGLQLRMRELGDAVTERERDALQVPTIRETPRKIVDVPDGTIPPGTTIAGRYRVLELVGRGGMGVVYRARDLVLDGDIAIKVLAPDIAHDARRIAFFRNEVRVARKVTHGNVCRLHDVVEADGITAIAMEYVDGEPLSARLRLGRLPLPDALAILRDVVAGVAAAHAAGVVHRDLKPSNVLLARGGRVVVADFGIAGEGRELGSGPQDVAGTRGYMAPEQASGAPLDARADVYALGVLACVLATGTRPIPKLAAGELDGGSAAALPVADASDQLAALPPPLAELIESCLAELPADRPADAREVARRLDAVVVTSPRRRRRIAVAAIIAAAAAGAIALATTRAPTAPMTIAPRVRVLPVDTGALPAGDRWLGPALQRAIANELVDGWALDADVGDVANAAELRVVARASRARSGAIAITIDGEAIEGADLRAVAITAAARVVVKEIPPAVRRPRADDLLAVGASDAEAWRWWRRAQREAWMQRWGRVPELCARAAALDPAFPMPHFEAAFSYDGDDAEWSRELAIAERLLAAAPSVRPMWRLADRGANELKRGDTAAAARTVEEARALPLDERERRYLDLRWTFALYYRGDPATAVPMLELIADRDRDDASAHKLLAIYYLSSDAPTAPALARKHGERAAALAPDDVGARGAYALALLVAGRDDDARAIAAELGRADPDDKRQARNRLFTLHFALGDPAEAELDARRQLTGSPQQRAEGVQSLAMLDLYWGRFDAGLRGLAASADAFDAAGVTSAAARTRMTAAHYALQLGDRTTATVGYTRLAAGKTTFAPLASALERVAAGDLAGARARAASLSDASADRARAELAIAAAARDDAGVLAAFARLEQTSTTIESLYEVGDALARSGRADDAAAAFARLVNHANAWTEPIASARAWYRLGVLRERAGDRAGARAALTQLVARWSAAAPAAPELDDARRRLRALDGP